MLKLKAFRFLFEDEINKAQIDGEARGEARGEAKGIIATCLDFGISKIEIINRLVTKIKCSKEEAEKMFLEFADGKAANLSTK